MNKFFCSGRLTRDPELKYTQSGKSVCNFGIAINKKYKDSSGSTKESVVFIDCAAWGRTGEIINEYSAKGSYLILESELQMDEWEKDGVRRTKISLNVHGVEFPPRNNDSEKARLPNEAPSEPIDDDEVPF